MKPTTKICEECYMLVKTGEYHPYAACLMYKSHQHSKTIRLHLEEVIQHGRMLERNGE